MKPFYSCTFEPSKQKFKLSKTVFEPNNIDFYKKVYFASPMELGELTDSKEMFQKIQSLRRIQNRQYNLKTFKPAEK